MRILHQHVAACLLALFPLVTTTSARAGLVATYQFQNTLAADQPGAPALIPVNSGSFVTDTPFGQSRSVYQRFTSNTMSASQSALRLDTTPLGLASNNYSVQIVFAFTDNVSTNAYRRVVNGWDPSSLQDPGLYVGPGNTLNLYDHGPAGAGSPLTDGVYYDVVLTVSASGENAYLNGALATSRSSTPDAIATHYLTFFQDEVTEYSNGRVALIRVFNSVLTVDDVTQLHNGGNPFPATVVPEPSTLITGGLAGLVGLGLAGRRRARA